MKRLNTLQMTVVLLGLFAALQFAVACLFGFLRLTSAHGVTDGLGLIAFFAASALWSFGTAAGIFRQRPWARISILVYAGCLGALAAYCGVTDVLTVVHQVERTGPFPLSLSFVVLNLFYVGLLGISTWWIAVFRRRSSLD
jgi:glucan phosphoethanolaminetransferase (alkaline phosphatase superfamily)